MDADAAFDGGVVQNIEGDRWEPIQSIDHLVMCSSCVSEMAALIDVKGTMALSDANKEIDDLRQANAELRVYAEHLEQTIAIKPKRPPGRPRKVHKDIDFDNIDKTDNDIDKVVG